MCFPCEFCKIFKNTFFTGHLRTTPSDFSSLLQISIVGCSGIGKSSENWCMYDKKYSGYWHLSEVATGGALLKKLFLKVSQNLQENTCARVLF